MTTAAAARALGDACTHPARVLVLESRGRFVEQVQRCLAFEHGHPREQAAHARRQRRRIGLGDRRATDAGVREPFAGAGRRDAVVVLELVRDRRARAQFGVLPQPGGLDRLACEVAAVELDHAVDAKRRSRLPSGECREQGRLAGATGADEREQAGAVRVQRRVADDDVVVATDLNPVQDQQVVPPCAPGRTGDRRPARAYPAAACAATICCSDTGAESGTSLSTGGVVRSPRRAPAA